MHTYIYIRIHDHASQASEQTLKAQENTRRSTIFICTGQACLGGRCTVDSKKLEHECRMIFAGCPSVFGLGLECAPVPTFWLLCKPSGCGGGSRADVRLGDGGE